MKHTSRSRDRALQRLRRLTVGVGGVSALGVAVFAVTAAQTIPGSSSATTSGSAAASSSNSTSETGDDSSTAASSAPSTPSTSGSGTIAAVSGGS